MRNPNTARALVQSVIDRFASGSVAIASEIASECAGDLNRLLQQAYDSRTTVYGRGRRAGKFSHKFKGRKFRGRGRGTRAPKLGASVSLIKSGTTRGTLGVVAIGTKVRAKLSTTYAKYLVGRYEVLPIGDASVPLSWYHAIVKAARRVTQQTLKRAA